MIWKKKKFWGTLIAVALLAYCLKDISLAELRTLPSRVDPIYLIPAVFCSFLFVSIKALRWRLMVLPQKKLPVLHSLSLYSAGQVVNIVMPALTGQVGRIFLFAKVEGLRKTFIFSTIVLEVLFDALTLVIFLMLTSLAFAFPEEYRTAGYVLSGVTLGLVILLYIILHFQGRLEQTSRRWFRDRWPGFYISIRKFLRSFTKGIEMLQSSQNMAYSILLSLLYWTAHVFVIFFLFKSFGMGLPLAAAAVVMIVNTLLLMVPITPGNAGTFELAVKTSLEAFNVPGSDAVLFALALHLLDLLPLWIMGMWFMKTRKVSIREIRSQHADAKLLDNVDENGMLIGKEETA